MMSYPTNEKRTNYSKLCRAIIDLCTDTLRVIMYRQVNPSHVKSKIGCCRDVKSAGLRPNHWAYINKAAAVGSYREFDITLLYQVLRLVSVQEIRDTLKTHIKPYDINTAVKNCPALVSDPDTNLSPDELNIVKHAVSISSYDDCNDTLLWKLYTHLCLSVQELRDTLKTHVKPSDINAVVKNCPALISDPDTKLCPDELNTVKHAVSISSYDDCKGGLLWKLYTHLCPNIVHPTKPWGGNNMPDPNHATLGDDVERIRIIRNSVYGHIPTTEVSNEDFNKYWSSLDSIMNRMNHQLRGPYKENLDDIRVRCMDAAVERWYCDEIEKLCENEKEVRKEIQKVSGEVTGIKTTLTQLQKTVSQGDQKIEEVKVGLNQKIEEVEGGLNQKMEEMKDTIEAANKDQMTSEIVLVGLLKLILCPSGEMFLQKLETAFEKLFGREGGEGIPFKQVAKEKLLHFVRRNDEHFSVKLEGVKWLVSVKKNNQAAKHSTFSLSTDKSTKVPLVDPPTNISLAQTENQNDNQTEMISKTGKGKFKPSPSFERSLASDTVKAQNQNISFQSCASFPDTEKTTARIFSRDVSEFLNDMNHFRKGNYVLISCKNERAKYLESLSFIPWLAVFDFDEDSREEGLLSVMEDKIKSLRAIDLFTWKEMARLSEYSTAWCLVRGSRQEASSMTINDPIRWSHTVRKKIESHLDDLVRYTEQFSVLKIVVLWPDEETLAPYLHKFINKIEEFVSPQKSKMILIDHGRPKSQDENTMISLMKPDYTLVSSLRDVCVGIGQTLGKAIRQKIKPSYQLPTSSGENDPGIDEAFASVLRENLEVLYLNVDPYGKHSVDIDEITAEEERFFHGATLNWFVYYECGPGHFDVERDITGKIVERIRNGYIKPFKSGVITLFHAPGAGGTTLARRVLWDLHKETPCANVKLTFGSNVHYLAQAIEVLYEKTHLPIVLVIDGDIENRKLFTNSLERAIVIMLEVCQHPYKKDNSHLNENQFLLPGEVSEVEAKKLGLKFLNKCDSYEKQKMIQLFMDEAANGIPHFLYELGLATYSHEYKGLQSYVKGYLMLEKPPLDLKPWQEILGFLALVHYYGQLAMPCQLFATALGKPPNYDMDLDDFPSLIKQFVVPCDDEGRSNYVRIGYHAISKEILEQILGRHDLYERKENQSSLCDEAKRHLPKLAFRFIDFLKTKKIKGDKTSGLITGIITKVFIIRDYKDTDKSNIKTRQKTKLSRLMEDIYSPPPHVERIKLMEKLVDSFPENPNFHAHLGRLYGIYKPEEEQMAEKCYKQALDLCAKGTNYQGRNGEDELNMRHTLMHVYHMYGMFYVSKISKYTGRKPAVTTPKNEFDRRADEILRLVDMACHLFSRGRESTPIGYELPYGYVGEIGAMLHVCDFILQNGPFKSLTDIMEQSRVEISKFVKTSCTYIFELMMECYSAVDKEDLGPDFFRNVRWFNHLFKNESPHLDNLGGSDDVCTRRLKASLIILKYGVNENLRTIDIVTSPSDVENLVQLYEENIKEVDLFGVGTTSKRALDLDFRDWINAIRHDMFNRTYTLEDVLTNVRQWHILLNSPHSKYYLFIILSIIGFGSQYNSGNSELLIETQDLKEELKTMSKYLTGKRIPREWLGNGPGIRCLIPVKLVIRNGDDNHTIVPGPNAPQFAILKGTISKPNDKVQSGFIIVDLGRNPVQINVFFVPIRTKEKLIGARYAGERVEFSLAFTWRDGYEAYNVARLQRIECNKCSRKVEIKSNEESVKCKCGDNIFKT